MVPALRSPAAAILEAGEAAMLRVGREPEEGVRQAVTSRGEGVSLLLNKAASSRTVSYEVLGVLLRVLSPGEGWRQRRGDSPAESTITSPTTLPRALGREVAGEA